QLARLDRADVDHPALVGADPDRAIALLDLDLEAKLATVHHLSQVCVGRASRALGRRGDVLHAYLEPNRRLPLGQVLVGEDRRVSFDHRDHPRGRQDADADGSADVREQPSLDLELAGALDAGLQLKPVAALILAVERSGDTALGIDGPALRHHTIPSPPETPSLSPVT